MTASPTLLPRKDWPRPGVGTVLGFDFGEARVGVAQGDLGLRIATPLTTVAEEATEARFAKLAGLIEEWQPVWLVVGLPSYPDGRPHPVAALAEKFGRRLFGRFDLPVSFIDESYTSSLAEGQLYQQGVRGKAHKGKLDTLAAREILQSFLDSYPSITGPAGTGA